MTKRFGSASLAAGAACAVLAAAAHGAGGISLSTTRPIISDGRSSAATIFSNNTEANFLTRAWVEAPDGKRSLDFIVTPPVAMAAAGKQLRFQATLVQPDEYPKDRESLFYFRLRAVPGNYQPDQNALRLDFEMKLKVFYRPEGITESMGSAIENLEWRFEKGRLTARNPSKLHVSLVTYALNADIHEVEDCVIPPGGEVSFKVTKRYPESVRVRWAAVDDYGTALRFATEISTNEVR